MVNKSFFYFSPQHEDFWREWSIKNGHPFYRLFCRLDNDEVMPYTTAIPVSAHGKKHKNSDLNGYEDYTFLGKGVHNHEEMEF